MKIIYSPHAKKRLKERKILKDQVKAAVEKPDSIKPSDRGRFIARKQFQSNTLEVIYVIENKAITIVTLYNI